MGGKKRKHKKSHFESSYSRPKTTDKPNRARERFNQSQELKLPAIEDMAQGDEVR